MEKIWQAKVFFGLIKSTLTYAHHALEMYSISWQIPGPEPVSQPSKKQQKTSSSLHPATSRFSWQISGSNIICVPVNFEPAELNLLLNSNEKIAACIPEKVTSANKTCEMEYKKIDELAQELFSTVIREFSPNC